MFSLPHYGILYLTEPYALFVLKTDAYPELFWDIVCIGGLGEHFA
jgi:hypothetical protein